MFFNPTVLQIGSHAFGLIDVIEIVLGLLFFLLIVTLVLAWRAQSGRRAERADAQARTIELEVRLAELSGAMNQFSNQAQNQQAVLQTTLDERLAAVTHRVGQGLADQSQRTAESLGQLHERLAVIDVAQNNLVALSNEMLTLKDILSNKQTRGAFGQGRMEAIISDGLHSKAYEFQASLSNGTRPDCIITLPDSRLKLVIDAKFPLEAYNDMKEAVDEVSAQEAITRLKSDVMKHVKDISEKYLIGGETHETAIMFVPSESIYVELNERFEDVIQRAHRAHIILASPNVLMLLIQTMQAIVRDAAMREQAGVIQAEVVKLLEDVNRMNERVGKLRQHFAQTAGDLDQLSTSTDKIIRRANKIESLELEEIQAVAPKPRLIK
ncbi:DNA recombination protein RmuC [Aestuariivirga litoralis]|uniref:DNA recombination protein RmuC n=1 Tax=Aestuariivirga litoralis TaxID=2650924 RepID=UPI0018C5D508|nr:DNA recombination protein RmuC [Aestuariivirga litoralis]MBG1232774.1 DNA recombination protein RmuC [Aestuariivirga litoralis]